MSDKCTFYSVTDGGKCHHKSNVIEPPPIESFVKTYGDRVWLPPVRWKRYCGWFLKHNACPKQESASE